MDIPAHIRNEAVIVFVQAVDGAVEPEGSILRMLAYVDGNGEFEKSLTTMWPVHPCEEKFYEPIAVVMLKDIPVPAP